MAPWRRSRVKRWRAAAALQPRTLEWQSPKRVTPPAHPTLGPSVAARTETDAMFDIKEGASREYLKARAKTIHKISRRFSLHVVDFLAAAMQRSRLFRPTRGRKGGARRDPLARGTNHVETRRLL